MEIQLKFKHRNPVNLTRARRVSQHVSDNNRASFGKHTPHPDVFAFRRNGYRCEARWNPRIVN